MPGHQPNVTGAARVLRVNLRWRLPSVKSSLHSFPHHVHHDCVTPLLQVILPGLEKQSIQSGLREQGGGNTERFVKKSFQKLLGVAAEEKKEQSRGPAYISLSSNSFMSSKLFQRPELLCLCCALKSLAALYEEKQWEHFRKLQRERTGGGRKKKWMAPLIKLSKLSHWPAVEINSKQGAPASQVMNILQTACGGWGAADRAAMMRMTLKVAENRKILSFFICMQI